MASGKLLEQQECLQGDTICGETVKSGDLLWQVSCMREAFTTNKIRHPENPIQEFLDALGGSLRWSDAWRRQV